MLRSICFTFILFYIRCADGFDVFFICLYFHSSLFANDVILNSVQHRQSWTADSAPIAATWGVTLNACKVGLCVCRSATAITVHRLARPKTVCVLRSLKSLACEQM